MINNSKYFDKSTLVLLLCLFNFCSFGQTIIVGDILSEGFIRRSQINGNAKLTHSLMIRPIIQPDSAFWGDSISRLQFDTLNGWYRDKFSYSLLNKRISFSLLPLTITQQLNSRNPYGWNDGAMIPSRGFQILASPGFFVKAGILSFQFRPEMVWAQNSNFDTFSSAHSDIVWANRYYFMNRIDLPEKFPNNNYTRFLLGQSSLRVNYKALSFGISSENLWWGPGTRNSLIMSNNAPGFKHVTFNTFRPITTKIGFFEFQIIAGKLNASGVLPPEVNRQFNGQALYTAKPQDWRYLNAAIITWQPKWTKGLFLGFSRAYYLYRKDMGNSVGDYIPILGSIFKSNSLGEDNKRRDQLASFFLRWILPKEKTEFYFEYGRNDFSLNLRDILMSPEHSLAYIVGIKKLLEISGKRYVELATELTQTSISYPINFRQQEGWYRHYQVRDGYTNNGQVLGAGIGPGSNSQMISIKYYNCLSSLGIMFERIVHDKDFFDQAFIADRNSKRYWTDFAADLSGNIKFKNCILSGNLSAIKSTNYQWGNLQENFIDNKNRYNRLNLQLKLGLKFLL